ncbi:MAG: dihydropteridine reductase [Oscillospiraceae bacterium]|nr:dihydropteridine reductase [Oscillospiraceae bacterium]
MNNENTFSFTYSAKENQEVLNIRSQYAEVKQTELDQLKALDAKVKRPANVFAYTYGSIAAIIMGAGMSLVMTEIGAVIGLANAMVPGIVIGVVGMIMALSTYPIYKKILSGRKKKYAAQILTLSEKIMNG